MSVVIIVGCVVIVVGPVVIVVGRLRLLCSFIILTYFSSRKLPGSYSNKLTEIFLDFSGVSRQKKNNLNASKNFWRF